MKHKLIMFPLRTLPQKKEKDTDTERGGGRERETPSRNKFIPKNLIKRPFNILK